MRQRREFVCLRIVLLTIVTLSGISCEKEQQQQKAKIFMPDTSYNCSFKLNEQMLKFEIIDRPQFSAYPNYKDGSLYDLTIIHGLYLVNDMDCLSMWFEKIYKPENIKNLASFGTYEFSWTKEDLIYAFKEGYYTDSLIIGKTDLITIDYQNYYMVDSIRQADFFKLQFDFENCHDRPPVNRNYFHLYDIHMIDSLTLGFKVDFQGKGISITHNNFQISSGHLKAFYRLKYQN